MSDLRELEQRLTEVLHRGAEAAPDATGLAGAARTRARQRRRTHLAGAGAVVALAVAAPTAWLAAGGDDDARSPDRPQTAADPTATDDGFRWESWHGVTVQVPESWAEGPLSTWCLDGDEPTPRVQRPGGVTAAIACTPELGYGLVFQEVDDGADFSWPVVHQDSGGWPEENVVGARGIGGVLVTVVTPDEGLAQRILDSAHAVGSDGDPNGCGTRLGDDPTAPAPGTVAVCRYDAQRALVQSESLAGDDAAAAERALDAAPRGMLDCQPSAAPPETVVLRYGDVRAVVELDGACTAIDGLEQPRIADADVLYWALSPGWSGDATGLPLPAQLRQQ